jgi:hypothetical protein
MTGRKPPEGIGWNPHTERPIIPQTVRARERECPDWKVIAVTVQDGAILALDPRTGESWRDDLMRELRRLGIEGQRVAVATNTPGELYEYMREAGPNAGAGFKAQGFVREAPTYLIGGKMSRMEEVKAAFTTYKWQKDRAGIILDPVAFCGEPAADVIGATPDDTPEATLYQLALWARSVIAWCRSAGFDLRPGRGGIAAQALTDARWWDERRRKVPRFFNDAARDQLPGNMYQQFSNARHKNAIEIDQRGAHHQAAARIAFTDCNTMMGIGWITKPTSDRVFCKPTDPKWNDLLSRPGLFWLRVRVDRPASDAHPPRLPQLAEEGERTIGVWSVELSELDAPGVHVLYCVAAIVSDPRRSAKPGLNGFAAWAQDELERADARTTRWLKPMLLAVYGALAQSARPVGRFSSEPTPASSPAVVIIGGQPIKANVSRSTRAAEPRYVNVVDRGMIEAETRMESLRMARALWELHDRSQAELVAIYADAVLVAAPTGERGGEWAGDSKEHMAWARAHDIRSRWRARPRSNLQMLNSNSYASDEVTKRPGIPKGKRQ